MPTEDSDENSGRVSVEHVDQLRGGLCQFTYHFGKHSWFPIVLHTTGLANEKPTAYRWHDLSQAFGDIIRRCIWGSGSGGDPTCGHPGPQVSGNLISIMVIRT
jgi:hypothetical protein